MVMPIIRWPDWFDKSEEAIYESKGCFEADVDFADRVIKVSFYDPVRLAQTVVDELENSSQIYIRNLVVLEKVNRETMNAAMHKLAKELE